LEPRIVEEINKLSLHAHHDWEGFTYILEQEKLSEINLQEVALITDHKTSTKRQDELASTIAQLYEDKIK
jgi:hypothetical protein